MRFLHLLNPENVKYLKKCHLFIPVSIQGLQLTDPFIKTQWVKIVKITPDTHQNCYV